jgi:hypothetical protein
LSNRLTTSTDSDESKETSSSSWRLLSFIMLPLWFLRGRVVSA